MSEVIMNNRGFDPESKTLTVSEQYYGMSDILKMSISLSYDEILRVKIQ